MKKLQVRHEVETPAPKTLVQLFRAIKAVVVGYLYKNEKYLTINW